MTKQQTQMHEKSWLEQQLLRAESDERYDDTAKKQAAQAHERATDWTGALQNIDLLKVAVQHYPLDTDCLRLAVEHSSVNDKDKAVMISRIATIAERGFKQRIGQGRKASWFELGDRPYLRALHHDGLSREKIGHLSWARSRYLELLSIDQTDRFGVKTLLIWLEINQGELQSAKKRLKNQKYPDATDRWQEWVLSALESDAKETEVYQRAISCNPFAESVALGYITLEKEPYATSDGSIEEGYFIAQALETILKKHPKLVKKLKTYRKKRSKNALRRELTTVDLINQGLRQLDAYALTVWSDEKIQRLLWKPEPSAFNALRVHDPDHADHLERIWPTEKL